MTAYAPTKRRSMNIPVEPTVYYTPPLAKGSGGNTYYFECPWNNVKLVYADATVTTTIATEALAITITDGTTAGYTVTTGSSDAVGTQVDGVLSAYITFQQGDTITITTTDSSNAGAAAARLFFESAS
jgi:hypothetical protein